MRDLRLAREGTAQAETRHEDRGIFSLANEWDRQKMVQGRINFSRGSRGAHAFKPGPHSDLTLEQTGPSSRYSLPKIGENRLSRRMADSADDWLMDSIERKRTRLLRISASQRETIETFVKLLFDEDSDACQDTLDAALDECGDPQKVVETLLQPAARIIDENWCTDECDFLKATIAMSRMQRLFRRMISEHPPVAIPDLSRCALLAPAPGEQHTFGLCVVEDAFRRGGWEVDCCGCDEEADMLRLVASNYYHVMGISVSVDRRLPELTATIRKVRTRSTNKSIVLIVGGSMVMQNAQGVIDAGFDLLAVDAVSAVGLADTVVASLMSNVHQRVAAE